MAKVDAADTGLYFNPASYAQIKPEEKKTKGVRKGEKTDFSSLFDSLRGKTADEIGPLADLPVCEESVNFLMDEVRSAGDDLKKRPLPQEIMRYKQAVRNFLNYVVNNVYSKEYEEGAPNFLKPGFKGKRGTEEAMQGKGYVKIQVIDRKLESLAAMLLSAQMQQMELVSRLEEIRGLLVDLLQ